MQGCANHTRVHCCGAVHDGDCRADLKSLSGKQLFEKGWLCPLCAPLPTEPARLALRLDDVKRQYRMLAARHVKLGMTAKGFAAACADTQGDELAPRRARGRSSDTSDASDAASSSGDDDTFKSVYLRRSTNQVNQASGRHVGERHLRRAHA